MTFVRRLVDLCIAIPALIALTPILTAAAVGIRISSPGPVFYRAQRVGREGRLFTMFKMRTMHCRALAGSSITAANDPRVFAVGKILRALKIDELPQLLNIIGGDMAIVGPRPEAPDIVDRHYTAEFRRSLDVPPGLTSPGSVFYYTHGEQLLADGEAEDFYVAKLLPLKMAIDLDYLSQATLFSDFGVLISTGSVLVQKALGRKHFPTPPALNTPPEGIETCPSHRSAA